MPINPETKNPTEEAIETVKKTTTLTPEQVERLQKIQKGENPDEVLEPEKPVAVADTEQKLDFDFGGPIIVGAGIEETVDQRLEATQIVSPPEKEPAVSETKPEKPIAKWNELNARKIEIIKELSGDLTKEDRKKLEDEMKKVSKEMIKQGCVISGRDLKIEEDQIQKRKEIEWEEYVQTQGGEARVKALEQQMLLNDKKAITAKYETIISNPALSGLSAEQKEILLNSKIGELEIGGRIILSKEDVAVCLWAGLNLSEVKRSWLGLGASFKLGKKKFDNINHLNQFIAQKKEEYLANEYLAKESGPKFEERKKEIIEQSIEQVVLDRELKELHDSFPVTEVSEGSKDLIKKLGGNFDNVEQMQEALGILQNGEDRYRELAEKIDTAKRPASKQKALKALEKGREKHKLLAKAMIELANVISKKDIYVKAQQKAEAEKGFSDLGDSEKKQRIGRAIHIMIKEIAEPFKKITKKEQAKLNKLYPFN
jgi:hypothetical protein